jgi:hypothetical protein
VSLGSVECLWRGAEHSNEHTVHVVSCWHDSRRVCVIVWHFVTCSTGNRAIDSRANSRLHDLQLAELDYQSATLPWPSNKRMGISEWKRRCYRSAEVSDSKRTIHRTQPDAHSLIVNRDSYSRNPDSERLRERPSSGDSTVSVLRLHLGLRRQHMGETVRRLIAILLLSAPCFAAIAFDATGSCNTDASATCSISITIVSANKGIIVANITADSGTLANRTVSTVKLDGTTAFTNVAACTVDSSPNRSEMWRLLNTTTTGTHTVDITMGGTPGGIVGGAVSLTGVDQTTPVDACTSQSGTGSPSKAMSQSRTTLGSSKARSSTPVRHRSQSTAAKPNAGTSWTQPMAFRQQVAPKAQSLPLVPPPNHGTPE